MVNFSPTLRRSTLVLHVAASVGWVGAVLAFLPLAVLAVRSGEPETVRGAYLGMEVIARYALVPLALLALGSGVTQSLVTRWGLLNHYWVLAKLGIAALSAALLLVYLRSLSALAAEARDLGESGAVPEILRTPSSLLHAGFAILALTLATALSVFKPAGLTRRGAALEGSGGRGGTPSPLWLTGLTWMLFGALALLALVLAVGGGHGPARHL
jgi:hypothetical protein